jgi:LAO/AO transport system kinase
MRRRLEDDLREDSAFQRLLEEVVERRLDPASAASTLLERAANTMPLGNAREDR